MAGNGSPEPSTGIGSLKAFQVTAAIVQQRPRLRECSGLRGKSAFRWAGAYSNASGHAFQYEAGRGFRFDPGHPACFYRSF